jgi:arsenate reductase
MGSNTKLPSAAKITIFHNPACGTSRNVLQAILDAGQNPKVVQYLKDGWRRDQLTGLLQLMGVAARDLLRVRGTPADQLGLTAPAATDAQILDAMVLHPILVERPIVVSRKGAALCRPAERVRVLL